MIYLRTAQLPTSAMNAARLLVLRGPKEYLSIPKAFTLFKKRWRTFPGGKLFETCFPNIPCKFSIDFAKKVITNFENYGISMTPRQQYLCYRGNLHRLVKNRPAIIYIQ
jgi:hypothetical protein